MKIISLTQDKVAYIDDEDLEMLIKFKWVANQHIRKGGCRPGLWYAYSNRYKQKAILMHRLIMSAKDGEIVDHRDGDGLNNRRYNLRLATHSQNLANSVKRCKSSSKYKGVYLHKDSRIKNPKKKWCAELRFNKIKYRIGSFEIEEDAARAYDKKALEIHGEFANLNFKEL